MTRFQKLTVLCLFLPASGVATAQFDLCLLNSQTFTPTGALDEFIVPPNTNNIRIVAIGAPGGTNFFGDPGGDGAHFEANFAVVPGETLRVGVGGQGGHAVLTGGGGGGGASFVARLAPSLEPLVIAGGGGGCGMVPSNPNNYDASLTNAAFDGAAVSLPLSPGGAAGINGNGGAAGSGIDGGGAGGAGWLGNGTGVPAAQALSGTAAGGAGGRPGGFGGGGGGNGGGGGGGGYNGGGGAGADFSDPIQSASGGGGGAYLQPGATFVVAQLAITPVSRVSICWGQRSVIEVPTLAPLSTVLLAVLVLAAGVWQIRRG